VSKRHCSGSHDTISQEAVEDGPWPSRSCFGTGSHQIKAFDNQQIIFCPSRRRIHSPDLPSPPVMSIAMQLLHVAMLIYGLCRLIVILAFAIMLSAAAWFVFVTTFLFIRYFVLPIPETVDDIKLRIRCM
jgi:uncharacterized membrane protein